MPFSWKEWLAEHDQDEIFAEYQSGNFSKKEMCERYDIPNTYFERLWKAYRAEHKLPDRRCKPRDRCRICGELLKTNRDGVSGCGRPECQDLLNLMPEHRKKSTRKMPQTLKPGRPIKRDFSDWLDHATDRDLEMHAEAYEVSDSGDRLFSAITDRRVSARPEAAGNPWGTLSRVAVAFRGVDTKGGQIFIDIVRKPNEAPLEALSRLRGCTLRYLEAFDYVVAWRCVCSLGRTYCWSVEDFPTEDGFHGTCPGCGGVAVRITQE